MKTLTKLAAIGALSIIANAALAETTRDCMLEGTVQKGQANDEQNVNVKFHSVGKYDQDSTCRVRRDEKMQFKLPADPRVQEAAPGSTVKYRYRTDSDGSAKAEVVSVGT